MNTLESNKKKLRKKYKRRRDAFYGQLDSATRSLAFRRPPSPLARLIDQKKVIAVYASLGSEAPTIRLVEYLIEMDKIVSFPKVVGAAPLQFRAVNNVNLLVSGFANIPEPDDNTKIVTPEIIITPMTAFDRQMGRLGQGGGHYDRTFEKYPDALRIGLAWSAQETVKIPMQSHDIQMQMIVTESEIIQIDGMTS